MVKKHMKKCSPYLAIKEMQMKAKLRFYLTPVRNATIKNMMMREGKAMQSITTTLENNIETF
jgi:hypothetical protein